MADETAAPAREKTASRGRLASIFVIVGLMVVEGVAVYFVANTLSPEPIPAAAAEGGGDGSTDTSAMAEVELAECRPSNKMAGRFVTYKIRVLGLVNAKEQDKVEAMARARRARLEEAVNVVIRSADPKQLDEPDLTTIERRIKYEFDRIFGDETLIREIVIPELLQSRPGV